MHDASEVSRRDFLKFVPKYLANSVHTFTQELSNSPDIPTQAKKGGVIDDNCVKTAEIDASRCMAWDGGSCQFCYLACPLRDKAITIEDQKPRIHSTICDGCAKCLTACETVNTNPAIQMAVMS